MSSETTTTKDAEIVYVQTGPVPILTISDLLNISEVIKSNEQQDIAQLNVLKNIDEQDIRSKIVTWGAQGFPNTYTIYSFQFHRSECCSDGIVRDNVMDYYNFLFPNQSLSDLLSSLELRLPGMRLTYSYTDDYRICVHISKV